METSNKLLDIAVALKQDGKHGFKIEESKAGFYIMGIKSHYVYGSAPTNWKAEMEREKLVQVAEKIIGGVNKYFKERDRVLNPNKPN